MWTWIIIGAAYMAIGFATFQYNAYLVRNDVMVNGLVVIRNAVLWPIFLPLLIWSALR